MMKSIIVLFAVFFLISPFVAADIIPPDSHLVVVCNKIVNIEDFPDASFIIYITGPMIEKYEAYLAENQACIQGGYKFNTVKIYSVEKSYLDSKGLENIDINADSNILSSALELGFSYYIENQNPLIHIDNEYRIAGFSGDKVIVYLSKTTSEFDDGTPNKSETYSAPAVDNLRTAVKVAPEPSPEPSPTPQPSPGPIEKGFWENIWCFFLALFGMTC